MADKAKIQQEVKQLSSKDAGKRRKAALALGKMGAVQTIPRLVKHYQRDPDVKVKAAAAEALGMFRKLEQEMLQGASGTARKGRSRLFKIDLVLLVTGILLVVLALVLPGIVEEEALDPAIVAAVVDDTAASRERATIFDESRFFVTQLRNDAATLQAEYQNIVDGGALNIDAFFSNPLPYRLSAADADLHRDLATAIAEINDLQGDLRAAKSSFDQARSGQLTLTAQNAAEPLANVDAILARLSEVEQRLILSVFTPTPPVGGAPQATQPPQATGIPLTPTLEPALAVTEQVNARTHITALRSIVSEVTASTGAVSLLNQNWDNVRQSGRSRGCDEQPPNIRGDYVLDATVAKAVPELELVTAQVNVGLGALRDGWSTFTTACSESTLSIQLNIGSQQAQLADEAFQRAAAMLLELQTSG